MILDVRIRDMSNELPGQVVERLLCKATVPIPACSQLIGSASGRIASFCSRL